MRATLHDTVARATSMPAARAATAAAAGRDANLSRTRLSRVAARFRGAHQR